MTARQAGQILARAARQAGRKTAGLWRAMPGPWPVRALLAVLAAGVLAVAVAVPGPQEELALAALAGWWARKRARKGGKR